MDLKTGGLTALTVAVTVAGIGTQSLPITALGLILSSVAYSYLPKPLSETEELLKYREDKLKISQKALIDERARCNAELESARNYKLHLDGIGKQNQEDAQSLEKAREEFQTNQQAIYEQILNQAKLQANQYAIQLFQQQWQQIQEREQLIHSVIPELSAEWQQKFAALEEETNAFVAQHTEECNQQLLNARQKVGEAGQFYQQIYAQATQGLAVELHELKQPLYPAVEYYQEYPKAAIIAERSLKFLYDKGYYLDFADCAEDDESVSLLIKPKKGIAVIVDYYQNLGKQLPALQVLAHGSNSSPEYRIQEGGFRIDFDISGLSGNQRTAKARSKEIEEMPADWLDEMVKTCFHFRVTGQTRAGKSVFVNNLLGMMKRVFNGKIEVILIDPKYPMSKWSIRPQYRGLEQSIIGLKAMADEVEGRLQLATQDADAGKAIRNFDPILYILDEVDTVSAHFNDPVPIVAEYLKELELGTKKACATLLKKGLKVGAALRVIVCYIGQSPLCSAVGMNKNDFNNSANFFLGENILPAIEEVAFKHQQPYLRNQYRLRQQRAEEQAGLPDQNLYKYFALVKAPGMSAKLVTLPLEGVYDFVPVDEPDNKEDDITDQLNGVLESLGSSTHTEELADWNESEPDVLVASGRATIVGLINDGITNPLEICRAIWGDKINPQARPYNGKNGVKQRIEYLVKVNNLGF